MDNMEIDPKVPLSTSIKRKADEVPLDVPPSRRIKVGLTNFAQFRN